MACAPETLLTTVKSFNGGGGEGEALDEGKGQSLPTNFSDTFAPIRGSKVNTVPKTPDKDWIGYV